MKARGLLVGVAVGVVATVAAGVVLLRARTGARIDAGVRPEVGAALAAARKEDPDLFRRKIVLLGFDSCDPDLVDQYLGEGKLPHFARLRRDGAYGPLQTIQPILSPVVWTTIATGVSPQRHGILDFVTQAGDRLVPVSAKMRQADTVWELLSQQGEDVGVVGWLVTWPAERTNGFVVTERLGRLAYEVEARDYSGDPQRTWPPELVTELKDDVVAPQAITLAKMRPFLDISARELDEASSSEFHPGDRVANLRLVLATAETFRNVGERLYAEKRPRFFACYFEAMDAISHLFMPFAPPKQQGISTDLYLKYRNAIEADYVWHDRVLGEFMDLCDADTTLIVVSDHGFKSGDFRMSGGSDFQDKTGAQWHRPYGVFYAWGNGVKRGASISGARVYDVAPTILAAMGYPRSEEMPGRVLTDVFENGLHIRSVPTYRGEARRDEVAQLAADADPAVRDPDEEDTLKKLESLGYIGGSRSDPASTGLNLGMSFLGQGRFQLAYQEFQKSLAKARADVADHKAPPEMIARSLTSVAEAALRTQRIDEAEKCVAEAEPFDPQDLGVMTLKARVLAARGKLDEAEKAARTAVQVKPDMNAGWAVLAYVLAAKLADAEKKDDLQARIQILRQILDAYERNLRIEPRQEETLYELARSRLEYAALARDVGAVTKAREELDRVLEMNPQRVNAYNNRAIAHLRLGAGAAGAGRAEEADKELAAALADVDKAIDIAAERYGPDFRGYDKGYANKAYVLWHMGRLADAEAAARRALDINPAYTLDRGFLAALRRAGHELPAPEAPQNASPAPQSAPAKSQQPEEKAK